jgi:4,5-DOPA dioxygenase extradiol
MVAQSRMPVLFVGHGSPMNAIQENEWSRAFCALAALVPAPRAILSVSAHWFVPGSLVTVQTQPETIHDFGGFPPELFDVQYPAPGDPALARRVVSLIGPDLASTTTDWGLDHGTWAVLHHMRPDADLPVVQLSLDQRATPADHLEIGRRLAPLRDEGVLILASGNITHNLRHAMMNYGNRDISTPSWAGRFDADVAWAAEQHDVGFLTRALETPEGRMSHPSPDHYLPLLYTAGASDEEDTVRFPILGFDLGSLSMRAILFGNPSDDLPTPQ